MIKKIAAYLCVFSLVFCLCGCEKSDDESNKATQSTPSTQIIEKDIESSEDMVGSWRVEHPWPAGEAKEFGESLGIENFVTTAKLVFFINLNSDGTSTHIEDYDLFMESAKESCYTIFSEAFVEAKQILDAETFEQKVKNTYGYDCYVTFLENNIPDRYKDSASYVQFFKEAQAEMLKYEDKPIEEQAAIGALWGEMSEEIEYSYEYVDGEWVGIKESEMKWSYSDGVLYYGEGEYQIDGNNQKFYATQGDTTITWSRLAEDYQGDSAQDESNDNTVSENQDGNSPNKDEAEVFPKGEIVKITLCKDIKSLENGIEVAPERLDEMAEWLFSFKLGEETEQVIPSSAVCIIAEYPGGGKMMRVMDGAYYGTTFYNFAYDTPPAYYYEIVAMLDAQ